MRNMSFAKPAGAERGGLNLRVVVAASSNDRYDSKACDDFGTSLCLEAKGCGVKMHFDPANCSAIFAWDISAPAALERMFCDFAADKVDIVIVIMCDSGRCYPTIKNIADYAGIASQCVKFKNVTREPRGYKQNLMLKINTKCGGVNHTLAGKLV